MARALSRADLGSLIPRGALAALGQGVDSAVALPGGRHVNLCLRVDGRGGSLVLRVRRPSASQPGADFTRELACHRAAAAAGLAPRVLDASEAESWMLLEYVPRPAWTTLDLQSGSRLERLCARLRDLHALPPPPLAAFDARGLLAAQAKAFQAGGRQPPSALDEAAAVAEALDALPAARIAICHGDPDVGNLLGEGPLLIDFEYAQLADPTYDLAALVSYYPRLEARIEGMLAAAGLDDPVSRERFPLQLRFARLINEVWTALQPPPLD